MTAARIVSALGAVLLGGAILVALVSGDLVAEGRVIFDIPWGWVSVLDVYTGVAIVATWIWWRDGAAMGAVWLVLLIVLGHLATALYVAWRAWTSASVEELLTGRIA